MKILAATNNKKHSKEAIKFAGELFKIFKPEFTILHVQQDQDDDSYKKFLEKEVKSLEKLKLDVKTKIRKGDIASGITKEVKAGSYDILVLGSRGINSVIPGVSEYVLGDIPRKVIETTEISTLIVKEPEPLEKILIAIDGSKASFEAVKFWGELEDHSRQKDSNWEYHKTNLISVIPEIYERFEEYLSPRDKESLKVIETLPSAKTKHLFKAKKMLNKYGVKTGIKLRDGDIVEEILKESDKDYDLIIIGRTGGKRLTFGPHVRQVVEQAKVPMLVVRANLGDEICDLLSHKILNTIN